LAGVRHKSGKQFTPHVTLLRDRISVPEQEIEPICWTAREFVLVHSLLGQTQHIPLGRWSLS
jgi:2'-5' RNA ligase